MLLKKLVIKSIFEQFITTQTRVGSTNGRTISQNAEILKFYFSTISDNLPYLLCYYFVHVALFVVYIRTWTVCSHFMLGLTFLRFM